MKVVVVDIGNTSTAVALYSGGRISRVKHIRGGLRKAREACEAAFAAAGAGGVNGVAIASVVPAVNSLWRKTSLRLLGCDPLFVSAESAMNVTVDYPDPKRIGADRLANSAGGVKRYGAPLIVADFGTALTFDVITGDSRYIGGVITPGIPLMTDYLFEKTALLPKVELKGKCPAVGRSTEEAIHIGAQIGYRGMVREITAYLKKSTGENYRLVATGGYAKWALADSGMDYTVDPNLTLFGIGCIFEENLK